MTNANPKVQYPGLRGEEQHHDLKNDRGAAGDPDHTETDGTVSDDVKKAVISAEADTEMAEALKQAVSDDKS